MPFRHGDLLPDALPELYEIRREAKELFAGRSEGRSSFIPDKERASELLLKEPHTRAHRRLGHMKTVRGLNETSRRSDLQESSGELDVHVPSSTKNADK
jgi:hypothetical protein